MSELERPVAGGTPLRSSPDVESAGPARIVRTGTNHVEVAIDAMSEPAEIAAAVSRIEQLLADGNDTVNVVALPSAHDDGRPQRSSATSQSGVASRWWRWSGRR